jgi:hypothetical protein
MDRQLWRDDFAPGNGPDWLQIEAPPDVNSGQQRKNLCRVGGEVSASNGKIRRAVVPATPRFSRTTFPWRELRPVIPSW